MSLAKIARAQLLLIILSVLGMAGANAQSVYFRAGATCAGATTASFATSGPTFQVTLCADTLASGRGMCNATIQPQSANAGESGRFIIVSRAIGAVIPDESSVNPTNISITNPPSPTDFGGTTSNVASAPAAADGQVLATFTIAPQSNATNVSYVISLSGSSTIDTAITGTSCLVTTTLGVTPSITLNLSAAPTFTSAAPPAGVVSTAYSHTFTASGAPAPTFSVTVGAVPAGLALAPGGALTGTPTTAGTFNFTVTATNGVNPPATQVVALTINAAAQTITFNNPGATAFSATPIASGATASSGLAVTLTSTTPAVCTITPASSLNITMVSAGSCTINANQAGNGSFGAAPQVSQTFAITAVAPGPPTGVSGAAGNTTGTVSFSAPAFTGGSAITGYAVTCTPAGGTDTNAGTTSLSHLITGLTNLTPYTCTVTATNAAGTSVLSAPSGAFTPSPIPVPPSFTSPASFGGFTVNTAGTTFNITATGTPLPTITLGGGTLPTGVVFTSGGANSGTATLSGTPTQAGTFNLTFTATGTAPPANQAFTLTVAAAAQTITFVGPAAQTFSATPVPVSATASSGLTVTFTSTTPTICTVSGTNVTMVTVGTCTIAANQAGNTNFAAAPQVTQSFAISQAAQTITFGAQPARGFSASPQAINPLATASSGLAVTYSSTTPGVCSVSGSTFTSITLGTCTIAANQAGNANFSAAAPVSQSFTINQGTQTISFGGLSNQSMGAAPILISATASSGLAVSFASQTLAVCTTSGVNGSTVTILAIGTCTIQATQAGNANFAAAAPVSASFQVVPPGAVTLTTSSNPAVYRTPLILTADISGTNPTGTVTFSLSTSSGAVIICSQVRVISGRATCPISGHLNVNNPTNYTANYSGDGVNPPNNAALQQLVNTNGVTLSVVTTPIQPSVGTNVVLKATVTGIGLTNKVAFNENGTAVSGCGAVTVALLPGATDIGVASCTVSGITAGTHNYVVTYLHTRDGGFEQVVVPVTPVSGAADFTDMWWVGPSENGWGVSITQHGRAQFIVFYVYDGSGNPIWYVLPEGTWNASNTAFTGTLYQPTSAPFSFYVSSQFRPGGVTGAAVGTATVTYTGTGTATLSYTINGVSGSKAIVRQPFGTDDAQARLQVGDMWWAGIQENGWGMNIAQHARELFPVWYTYDSAGRTVFYTVPGGVWTGSTFTGDIYSTVSSVWLGVNYNPAQFVVTKVGKMSLDFSDQSNAVMTYDISGLVQKKVITRQPYP